MPPYYIRWPDTTGTTLYNNTVANIIWHTNPSITGGTLPIFYPQAQTWTTMGFNTNTTWIDQQNLLVMMAQQQQIVSPPMVAPAIICGVQDTEERRLRRTQEIEAAQARDLETRRAIEVAEGLAQRLLQSHLTPEQRASMKKHNWFIVEGGKSKKKYRIDTGGGPAGNIKELDHEHKVVARYCAHCEYGIPNHDQFLAQKFMIECDEEVFLRIANRR